jgi:hypothetical protein
LENIFISQVVLQYCSAANMEAQRRLQIISGHLVPHGASRPDVLALQRLLDHDNIELRARMKDFFKDELYVPRYVGSKGHQAAATALGMLLSHGMMLEASFRSTM